MTKLEGIKLAISETDTNTTGNRLYGTALKKEIIAYHYSTGMYLTQLSRQIGISSVTLYEWKRRHGKEKTAFVHGKKVRNDVRTKCLAVSEIIDGEKRIDVTAMKYDVSITTIRDWLRKYKDRYQDYIETLPDGVPYIVKEKKQIFGDANVEAMAGMLKDTNHAIDVIMKNMHDLGKLEGSILIEIRKDNDNKLEKLEQYSELKKELGLK